ncbi:ABC transporter substrate-binding protein [Vibrio cholerae]
MKLRTLGIAIATACSSLSVWSAETIDFWTPFTGPDGAFMQKLVDDYNQQNQDFDVKMQVIPGDVYYEKIRTASRTGNGPLVSVVHADQIPGLAVAGLLTDVEDIAAEQGLTGDKYIKAAWDIGVYKGNRYGIPLDVHPLVMYYNKDIVEQYDLNVPTTYEALISESKKITDANTHGFALPTIWPTNLVFRTAMLQNGEDVINSDGRRSNVNGEVGLKAAQKIEALWKTEQIAPAKLQRDGHIVLFKQGKAAFTIDGIWMSQGFTDAKVNYAVAPMTTLFGDTPAVWANSHQLTMLENSKADDATKVAAIDFIKYLSEHGVEWAKANMIPASLEVINSAEFQQLPIPSTAAKQMDHLKLAPQVDTWIDIWTSVESHLSDGLLGNTPLPKALDRAAKEGNQKAAETLEYME